MLESSFSNLSLENKTGLNRNQLDKFYTQSQVVTKCIDMCLHNLNINKLNDIIIEPSAGQGSFTLQLIEIFENVISYDIEPENEKIIKQDYLKLETTHLENKTVHIIGNPPFGRQSSLAKKFIKKSCEFANSISFILPKSFKKQSLQKIFPLNFHLIKQIDLDKNSFTINDKKYDVPCVFQIWIKKNESRQLDKIVYTSNYFKFVKKHDNPDISIRRVGVNAGNLSNIITDKNVQTHYFIKFTDEISKTTILEKYKTIIFESDNTEGPKSISKTELTKKINELFL